MTLPLVTLAHSDLHVTPICLGTMTFGEQVKENDAHDILDHSLARGVNFIDTAEIYSVPTKAETFGATETIIGNWLAKRPGARQKIVLATKVAGPSRGMPWVREGDGLSAKDIVASCDASLKRLQTDVIDLYQIHWPERHVPAFGMVYYDPQKEKSRTPIQEQLETLATLVKAYVVLAAGYAGNDALVQELQHHVRGKLAPYEYPKEIEFIPELPMTTTGKVQRRVLRLQEEARAKAQ